MAKYGFFNSLNGDRTYDADDLSDFFLKLIPNGILRSSGADPLKVSEGTGMTVEIAPGYAFIQAKYLLIEAATSLTIPAADSSLDRIDRVVIRLDRQQRKMYLRVSAGTPAATPEPPELARLSSVYDLSLATISVSAGATAITDADITDDRSDSALCGLVSGFSALGGLEFLKCTQAEYDAMTAHDADTIYIIVG